MRRFFSFALLVVLCLSTACAQAEAMDAIFDAVNALGAGDVSFATVGDLLCVTAKKEETVPRFGPAQLTYGLVFRSQTGERIGWDDLFADGGAAAQRLEETASAWLYDNAYGSFDNLSPMPRDNFVLGEGTLTVYYPVTQLSWLSGRQVGVRFFAYELEGLLREDVPLARGDSAQADEALSQALATGCLPGLPQNAVPGVSIAEADAAFGLVDVPDVQRDAAVYSFEAAEMGGVWLLSPPEQSNPDTAVANGIFARRIDFSGLCPGVSTQEECLAALRAPDATTAVVSTDGYDRLPEGETALWYGDAYALEMHFAGGLLYSVALFAR